MINYLISVLFVTFTLTLPAQDIADILSKMPPDDRKALESLFHQMIYVDNFSYTLFGDKPISLSGDFILTPNTYTFGEPKCGGGFWKNWKVWKKYEDSFPISNYLLIEEPSIICKNVKDIILINKIKFTENVNRNIKLFRKILGKNTTASKLLKKIETTHKFASVIKNNEILWGVLLGYGLHNAQLYDERLKLERFINFKEMPKIPQKKPLPSNLFSSTEEEYEFIDSKLSFFGERFYSPLVIPAVYFVADLENPETKALEKKYRKLRGKISAIYAHGDFLEITLSQLIKK